MGLLPPDFESGAYTNFATQARTLDIKTLRRVRQEEPDIFGILTLEFKGWLAGEQKYCKCRFIYG